MPPRAIIDDDLRAEPGVARQRIPDRRAVLRSRDPVDIGGPARRQDDEIGLLGQNVGLLDQRIEPDLDAKPLQFLRAPIDDADEVLAPAGTGSDQNLPAKAVGRLEQDDLVAPFGADAGGFEPRRSAADDDDLPRRPVGRRDAVAEGRLASARRVVEAGRAVLRLTMGRPDARADRVLEAGRELRHDMRIGDMGARHRHHIEQPLTNGVAGGRDIGDAGGMEDGQRHRPLELTDPLQPRGDRRGHPRHVVARERGLRIHPPVDGVEEVDPARPLKDLGDRHAFFEGQAAVVALVDDEAEPDQEILAHPAPDFVEHHEAEAATVLPRSAECVGPPVGFRRQELADEMPSRQHLDAVETALLAAQSRRTIGAGDAPDVMIVHLLGEAAMQRLTDRRGRDGRQPVRGIGLPAPAEMRDLTHQRGAVRVNALREPRQMGNDLVDADIELPKDIG